jgi:predicted ATPase with chaperone activity
MGKQKGLQPNWHEIVLNCVHPCPSGYYEDSQRPYTCGQALVTKYQERISGPFLDRVDIHIELARSKEIVVKTVKSLDDLTGLGDADISRIAQSIYTRLDKATAATEIRAASLDEQIDQVLWVVM